MKKLLPVMLSAAMALSMFTACGNSDSSSQQNSGSQTQGDSQTQDDSQKEDDSSSGDAGTGGTYKIGGIGPLTGAAAVYGIAVRNGAQIAVDEINAMGGDIKFEINFQDDEHDPEKSVNAYNTLKDWGMQALVGCVTTTPCIAVAAESYNDRIFEVTPSASSTDVIKGKDNVFQVCFTDPNQGTASAQYIAENSLASKVAVIYKSDDAYSKGIYDTFAAEAANENLEIVYAGTFTTDTENDFSVQLTEAQKAGAELVFLPMYYTPASLILGQADSMGYSPIFFGVDGMDGILTLKGFNKELAEGVMLLTPFSADAEDERTVNFVTKYQEQFGETPNQFAADAYDSVYTIYAALGAAGVSSDSNPQDICEALVAVMPQISVDGLTGQGMTWEATGEVSKAPMAVTIKNGVYVGNN
ncbi:MAG: ABC transporter substrate-binding protein [Firmicutes bacterium]|nr:ABC transporter substrate-binding protein [Bacillota bacterium]